MNENDDLQTTNEQPQHPFLAKVEDSDYSRRWVRLLGWEGRVLHVPVDRNGMALGCYLTLAEARNPSPEAHQRSLAVVPLDVWDAAEKAAESICPAIPAEQQRADDAAPRR